MFADDTNLFMTGKSITEIETRMNIELDLLVVWFRTNQFNSIQFNSNSIQTFARANL